MEHNNRITINPNNTHELVEEATNNETTESYLPQDKNTTANSLSLDQRTTTVNASELDNLFIDDKLTIAQDIYNKLTNNKEISDFEKLNLFFELHSLAKPEYKQLFNIDPTTNGCQLSIADQLSIKITNELIVSYLQADVEKLSTSIIAIIKNEELNNANMLRSVFKDYTY